MESIRNYDVSIRIVTDSCTLCDVYGIRANGVAAAKHKAPIRALAENKNVEEVEITFVEEIYV
jgi:hypothetical protein